MCFYFKFDICAHTFRIHIAQVHVNLLKYKIMEKPFKPEFVK